VWKCPESDTLCKSIASTSSVGLSGCGFFSAAPFTEFVDQLGHTYLVYLEMSGGAANSIRTIRIYYRQSISYSPANPTFSDVAATHPFYRYIEALVASGITAGCAASPPQYCPDAPLTRGQMAVFLARGLGLFWPQ
jgi:S-layer family protein